jgi:hypothetical protein
VNRFLSITLIAAALFVSGCATERVYREGPSVVAAPPALTLAQIKEMTAKGVSDETILSALRASRAVYRLTSADVVDLQQANVSQAVIDYLLSTPQLYPAQPVVRYRTYYYYDPWPYWWWYDWHWHYDWHHGFHHGHH